jgi:hypothetical protein
MTTFATTDTEYRDRSGQGVAILRRLDEEIDEDEVGPMYRIRFGDGVLADAFADELTPTPDPTAWLGMKEG